MGKLQQRLVTAGYRNHEAIAVFFGIRLGCALRSSSLLATPIIMQAQPGAWRSSAARWATCCQAWRSAASPSAGSTGSASACPTRSTCSWSASKRGSASIRRFSASAHELDFAHPDLSEELRLINLELRAGKARADALHNLAERTGVDDIVVAGRDARADRQVRHQRGAVAARPLRDRPHETAAARRRSGGQDRREDGLPARVLHLSRRSGS